jgi:hypothetical protein
MTHIISRAAKHKMDGMRDTIEQANTWTSSCTQWIEDHVRYGEWKAYYVNFMFEPLPGSSSAVVQQMRRAIVKFYGRFSSRFVHNQHSQAEQDRLPRFWLYPDRPGLKRSKLPLREVKSNDGGLHFHGAMLTPVFSRFRQCPIKHIEEKQAAYCHHGITRIHVKRIDEVADISSYMAKTVRWGRAELEDILILPRSKSEFRSDGGRARPRDLLMKDVQAAWDLSPELAQNIATDRLRSPMDDNGMRR